MSPDPKQHFGAISGLTLATPDGQLIFNCVVCQRQIPDGEGALMAQAGEPWQARCFIHEPPPDVDGQRPCQVPVEELRTAEQVLIQMAGWVEMPWRTPNFGPLIFALSRALRNANLQRLSDLERLSKDEEDEILSSAEAAAQRILDAGVEHLWPPMEEDRYRALVDGMRVHGYLEDLPPIFVDEDGRTLDGFQRQRAASELGITPPIEVITGSALEKLSVVIMVNANRRYAGKRAVQNLYAELARRGVIWEQVSWSLDIMKGSQELADLRRDFTPTSVLINIRPEVWEACEAKARDWGKTMGDVVGEVLTEWVHEVTT
jgi:hypothetical protein